MGFGECLRKESDAGKLIECKIPLIDFFTQKPDSVKAIEPIDKEIKRIEGLIEAHKAQAYQRRKKGLAAEIKQVCNGEIAEIIAPETKVYAELNEKYEEERALRLELERKLREHVCPKPIIPPKKETMEKATQMPDGKVIPPKPKSWTVKTYQRYGKNIRTDF